MRKLLPTCAILFFVSINFASAQMKQLQKSLTAKKTATASPNRTQAQAHQLKIKRLSETNAVKTSKNPSNPNSTSAAETPSLFIPNQSSTKKIKSNK